MHVAKGVHYGPKLRELPETLDRRGGNEDCAPHGRVGWLFPRLALYLPAGAEPSLNPRKLILSTSSTAPRGLRPVRGCDHELLLVDGYDVARIQALPYPNGQDLGRTVEDEPDLVRELLGALRP